MLRKTTCTVLIFVLFFAFVNSSSQAKSKTLDELSLEILETMQTFYPVRSTEMGNHHYDMRLVDYSSKSVKSMIKKLNSYEKQLYRFKKANLNKDQRLNYNLIKANCDMALLDLKQIAWHKKSPMLYVDNAINGLYSLMLSQHATLYEKRVFIVSRMKAVPGLFATARKNLKNVPPIYIEAALETLEAASDFYREIAGELMNKFPDHADRILKVSTAAREAMNDFSVFLSEMKPGDEKAFAIGREYFDYLLEHEHFLGFDSDSLLKLGETYLMQAQEDYAAAEEHVETYHQNGKDSVFVPAQFSRQDLLDYYAWETRQMRIYCQQSGFVTVPDDIAEIDVIETPPFLRSMIPGIAYHPAGPFDDVQKGLFYIRPLPEEMDRHQLEARYRYVHRRGFKGSVVHEAFPGHHLQMQIAGQNQDPVHQWQTNMLMIEGWALYCEQSIYEHGLYGESDPSQYLAILGGIRFRAARIISDVKLHTGQFTAQECIDWMTDVLEITIESGQEYIRKEVRKQTMFPGNRMSYLIGKKEILRLRQAAEQIHGNNFTLLGFHDELLSYGSIPPPLLWDLMELR